MLTNKETLEVDEYIQSCLTPTEEEYEEIDDFIVACSCDKKLLQQFERLVDFYMRKLCLLMEKEFVEHNGVTIKMIAAQERFYQLKLLKNKSDGIDSTEDLAMLCIASSFDFYWLSLQAIHTENDGSNTLE